MTFCSPKRNPDLGQYYWSCVQSRLPPFPHQPDSCNLAWLLAVDLCIHLHQLLDEGSMMTEFSQLITRVGQFSYLKVDFGCIEEEDLSQVKDKAENLQWHFEN
ncbi:hypothetical protein STEG23_020487, partial [Scotinomys teguina]